MNNQDSHSHCRTDGEQVTLNVRSLIATDRARMAANRFDQNRHPSFAKPAFAPSPACRADAAAPRLLWVVRRGALEQVRQEVDL
jgi:hypothetical protein